MKKQALKAVTMLVSIIALAFMTAVATNAQSGRQLLRANVPFDFVVGDKTLAAGEYNVAKINQDATGIQVLGANNHQSALRLTSTVQANAPKNRAMLIFHRYGDRYFLAQVWTPGSAEGREMSKSKAERAVERELSRIASNKGGATAEIVTIYAEMQ
ncbi:MAG: hypothetical protein DMF68_18635 [Acidobacteria bacterium]|nr:MAG: hypothetical protein DMF68_18635 [Acidobacteriota bacterium]